MKRIRYTEEVPLPLGNMDGSTAHIRTRREGFVADAEEGTFGQRIRLGDRDWGHSQHVKSHVRHNNRNNMFSGMMGDCVTKPMHIETFRFTEACGPNDMPC
jgi:hypothetical protein